MRERRATRSRRRSLPARVLVPLRAGVPRLRPGEGTAGAATNLAGLVLVGLLGAALLHLAAYHLRPDGAGAYLLAHCPWRLAILAVLLISLSNGLLFRRELRVLLRELSHLAARLRVGPEEEGCTPPAGAPGGILRRPLLHPTNRHRAVDAPGSDAGTDGG